MQGTWFNLWSKNQIPHAAPIDLHTATKIQHKQIKINIPFKHWQRLPSPLRNNYYRGGQYMRNCKKLNISQIKLFILLPQKVKLQYFLTTSLPNAKYNEKCFALWQHFLVSFHLCDAIFDTDSVMVHGQLTLTSISHKVGKYSWVKRHSYSER